MGGTHSPRPVARAAAQSHGMETAPPQLQLRKPTGRSFSATPTSSGQTTPELGPQSSDQRSHASCMSSI